MRPNINEVLFYRPLIKHYDLVMSLSAREMAARNANTYLGWLWGIVAPLIQIAMYTFVFAYVFNVRWSGDMSGAAATSALKIFLGLTVFNLLADCVGQAPNLILGRVALVKKVVFPLEILPYVTVTTALRNFAINLLLFFVLYLTLIGQPAISFLLLPIIILPLILISLGAMWFISSLSVFLRDMRNIVPIIMTILMFMSAIFYPSEILSVKYPWLLRYNILAWIIEQSRDVIFSDRRPDPIHLLIVTIVSALIASVGYWWFIKTKKAFADVI